MGLYQRRNIEIINVPDTCTTSAYKETASYKLNVSKFTTSPVSTLLNPGPQTEVLYVPVTTSFAFSVFLSMTTDSLLHQRNLRLDTTIQLYVDNYLVNPQSLREFSPIMFFSLLDDGHYNRSFRQR